MRVDDAMKILDMVSYMFTLTLISICALLDSDTTFCICFLYYLTYHSFTLLSEGIVVDMVDRSDFTVNEQIHVH